ncbi:MAG: nuclear transport factor 2 family protein [Deltaproteobacteria bacterium]|nr:nuclear transport factor 2 family protein [Deltaproteobacteria bacterium]
MKRNLVIAAISIVLAVGIWALFFRGSDDDRVRKTVRRAADAVAVVPGENPVMRATRVRSELLEVLAPEVSASIPELGELGRGRDPLIGAGVAAAQAWQQADIGVTFSRVQIDDGKSAFVDLTATLTATRHGAASERDQRRCSLRLEKRDGTWRITEITVHGAT